jgi:hypothetical protein
VRETCPRQSTRRMAKQGVEASAPACTSMHAAAVSSLTTASNRGIHMAFSYIISPPREVVLIGRALLLLLLLLLLPTLGAAG